MDGIGARIKGNKFKRQKKLVQDGKSGFFLASKDMRLQNLPLEQLLKMIGTRNEKFKACVEQYLKGYQERCGGVVDDGAMKELEQECSKLVPQYPEFSDPVAALELSEVRVGETNDAHKTTNLDDMIKVLKKRPFYRNQIVLIQTLTPSQPARYQQLKTLDGEVLQIHPDLEVALKNYKGIEIENGLYLHQAEALQAIIGKREKNNHVIVSTSTSSGKSLIYQIPILNDILWDITNNGLKRKRYSTAFFIFPTKALAQDQKRHLQELINHIPLNDSRQIIVNTYDGDTPSASRRSIRLFSDIIFTNPDTIHASILPNYYAFGSNTSFGMKDFLENLRYIVVDELHVYKGTFGIHVGFVMSRLGRLLQKIVEESDTQSTHTVQFISCSATIMNPKSHFKAICGLKPSDNIVHIAEDGSPCSEKRLVAWTPPPLMNKKGDTYANIESFFTSQPQAPVGSSFIPRENIIGELAKVLLQLLKNLPSIKVIVFCPVRQVCELMMKEIRINLKTPHFSNSGLSDRDIMSYRGGYSKKDRRIIERKMFSGELRAIVATNALELGIDLSDLDVVITCGFPMLKLNLHQQFGRAGRSKNSEGSLAIFIGGNNPLDQYYSKNSSELCDKTYEDLCVEGLIDIGLNKLIMEMHLQCAAFEYPIDIDKDMPLFVLDNSITKQNMFIKLVRERLHKDDSGRYRTHPRFLPWPAEKVPIRAIEDTNYAVVDVTNGKNIVIEEIEALRTSFTLYEGAIFLHQGVSYLVKEFDSDQHYAKVEKVNVDWITQQRDFTDVDPIKVEFIKCLRQPETNEDSDMPLFFGSIEITIVVFGFFKVNRRSEILEAVEVKNPPIKLHSKGFWIDIPNKVLNLIKEKKLSPAGGIHAAQHAIMNILPLFIAGGATTNPNVKFSSNVGESELMTECKAPEKEFALRQSRRIRPARLIFYDAKGGPNGSGVAAKTFEHFEDILNTTYLKVKECDCEWGCPGCVTASFCKEMLLVMSKPAAILILGGLLGKDLFEIKTEVADGPEPNMPNIKIETIQEVSASVCFADDIQILEEKSVDNEASSVKKEEDDTEFKDIL